MMKRHDFLIFIKLKRTGNHKVGLKVWQHPQFCINAQVKFSKEKNVTQKVLHSLVF